MKGAEPSLFITETGWTIGNKEDLLHPQSVDLSSYCIVWVCHGSRHPSELPVTPL